MVKSLLPDLVDKLEPYWADFAASGSGSFGDYLAAQERVAIAYAAPEAWARMAISNVARVGRVSSDRTIREYARDIWDAKPVP